MKQLLENESVLLYDTIVLLIIYIVYLLGTFSDVKIKLKYAKEALEDGKKWNDRYCESLEKLRDQNKTLREVNKRLNDKIKSK
jgi:septation ring formation regulator EzrA